MLAFQLRLFLSDQIDFLITPLPLLDELPVFTFKAETEANLLEAVRKMLISSPRVRQVKQLMEKARLVAQNKKFLKPSLTREVIQYVPFKMFLTWGWLFS